MTDDRRQQLYQSLLKTARAAGVFRDVRVADGRLLCEADHVEPETEAIYFAELEDTTAEQIVVGFQTANRWLSQSIEADLVHTGDAIEELLEEELIAQGLELSLPVEHFRDAAKRYTFRSRLPLAAALDAPETADRVLQALLAYQACFLELGDMAGEADE